MRVAKRVQLPPDDDSEDDGNDGEDDLCEQCGSGERPEELLLCDKCNKGFHMLCLRPIVVRVPIGPWHCPHCSGDQNRTIKSTNRKNKNKSKKMIFKKLNQINNVFVCMILFLMYHV